jgi:hypothetical protein
VSVDIAPYDIQAQTLVDNLRQTEITSDDEFAAAGELVKVVKRRSQELQAVKDGITKPMRESLSATQALFKPVESRYEEAERLLKEKISTYLKRRQEENRAALQAAAAANDITTAIDLASKAAPVQEGISTRVTFDAEIVDESLIPREYLVPDFTKIRAVVRASKGTAVIPGVRAVERTSVAVKT